MKLELDDVTVLRNISTIRAQANACTIRELGRRMHMNESTLRVHITSMRERGIVSINDVPGSLCVTELGQAKIDHQLNGERIDKLMAQGMSEADAILTVYPQLADSITPSGEGDRDESCQTSAPDPVAVESSAPVSPAPVKKRAYKKRAAKKRAPRTRDQ